MIEKPRKLLDTGDIEPRPDGEERFLAAVHAAAKSGPKHRSSKAKSVVKEAGDD